MTADDDQRQKLAALLERVADAERHLEAMARGGSRTGAASVRRAIEKLHAAQTAAVRLRNAGLH